MAFVTTFQSGKAFTSNGIDRVGKNFVANRTFFDDVQKYRAFRLECLKTSLSILREAQFPQRVLVGIRLKRLDSIHRKLSRQESNFRLSSLDDVIGIRVICPSLQEVVSFSNSIKGLAAYKTTKDYTEKEHHGGTGYRGIHHIMKFQQSICENRKITVRFEIQVRSYYQHMWAVWSESFGENIKQGGGYDPSEKEEEIKKELELVSKKIAVWENENANQPQDKNRLPLYEKTNIIAVVFKQPSKDIIFHIFKNNTQGAVKQLNYWEQEFPHQQKGTLLLAGLANSDQIQKVLSVTHPLYVLGQAYKPEYWMPEEC